MKVKGLGSLLASLTVMSVASAAVTAVSVGPAEGKTTKAPAAKKKEFPKVMTGFDTQMSVQILRVIRSHVEGFGHNAVVVVQYRLRKEGANPPGSKPFEKDKFWPRDIKARDPAMGQAFTVWQPNEENETYSKAFWTSDWNPGQTGDGYVWLKVPERVNTIDIFFPFTNPQRVNIEVPR